MRLELPGFAYLSLCFMLSRSCSVLLQSKHGFGFCLKSHPKSKALHAMRREAHEIQVGVQEGHEVVVRDLLTLSGLTSMQIREP